MPKPKRELRAREQEHEEQERKEQERKEQERKEQECKEQECKEQERRSRSRGARGVRCARAIGACTMLVAVRSAVEQALQRDDILLRILLAIYSAGV